MSILRLSRVSAARYPRRVEVGHVRQTSNFTVYHDERSRELIPKFYICRDMLQALRTLRRRGYVTRIGR